MRHIRVYWPPLLIGVFVLLILVGLLTSRNRDPMARRLRAGTFAVVTGKPTETIYLRSGEHRGDWTMIPDGSRVEVVSDAGELSPQGDPGLRDVTVRLPRQDTTGLVGNVYRYLLRPE